MPGNVALTGATGFIGRSLLESLVRNNWQVRALTRRPRAAIPGVSWLSGDLSDPEALYALVKGTDVIIHCAGQVRGNSLEHFMETNTHGTERLAVAALNQPNPPRFLLISSLAAREPALSWYAYSKQQGEQVLLKYYRDLSWGIFRPTAVYGPGDREMTPLFRATRMGLLPVTGSNSARFGLIYVDDVVSAVLSWLDSVRQQSGIYELDDGTAGGYDYSLVKTIASQVWGHPVLKLTIPVVFVRALAAANLGLSRLFRYQPMLTPGKVRELTHINWVCNNQPLQQETGWRPGVQLREGLPRAVHR